MGSTRKRFTEEYKKHAVNLILVEGWSYSEAAKSFGVHEMTVRNWVAKSKEQPDVAKNQLEIENKRLLKENKRLQIELAFSKN